MSLADAFVDAVTDGPLLVALLVSATAGLVSFLSPCVLPLVPGYLSFVTGLAGADLESPGAPASGARALTTHPGATTDPPRPGRPGRELPRPAAGEGSEAPRDGGGPTAVAVEARPSSSPPVRSARRVRGRVLLGSALFVLGFTAVFVTSGALFGGLGGLLLVHKALLDRVLGAVTVLMGLAFLGLLPGLQRELRFSRLPAAGLAGAPLLGVMFGVGWTPCLGPTLGAVQTLAYTQASAGRGALLTAAYCAGLGVPFVLTGLAFRRAVGAFAVVRRHSQVVTRVGGGLLIAVGLLLVSGVWEDLMIQVRSLVSGFTTAV